MLIADVCRSVGFVAFLLRRPFVVGFVVGQVALVCAAVSLFRWLYLQCASDCACHRRLKVARNSHANDCAKEATGLKDAQLNGTLSLASVPSPECPPQDSLSVALRALFSKFAAKLKIDEQLAAFLEQTVKVAAGHVLEEFSVESVKISPAFCVQSLEKLQIADAQETTCRFAVDWHAPMHVTLRGVARCNWPVKNSASLPLLVSVEVKRVCGTLNVAFGDDAQTVMLSFDSEDFLMEVDCESAFGHASSPTIDSFPKLNCIISNRLVSLVERTLVHPHRHTFETP